MPSRLETLPQRLGLFRCLLQAAAGEINLGDGVRRHQASNGRGREAVQVSPREEAVEPGQRVVQRDALAEARGADERRTAERVGAPGSEREPVTKITCFRTRILGSVASEIGEPRQGPRHMKLSHTARMHGRPSDGASSRLRSGAVLVCPDEVFGRRLRALLATAGLTTRRIASAGDAARTVTRRDPEVVVLAQSAAPEETAGAIRDAGLWPVIVVIAEDDAPRTVKRLIAAGADVVIARPYVRERLVPAVRAALAGQMVLPRVNRPEIGRPSLSPREREALQLLALGLTNKEIGARLFVTESTIKTHLYSAYAKLGVHTRAEAMDLLHERGAELGIPSGSPLGGSSAAQRRAAHAQPLGPRPV